jgi:hypothetical protein
MLCGLYLLIREMGGTRRNALIGAAAMGFLPTAFILTFSFMTDLPFLAGLVWASLLFVQGLRRRDELLLWTSVVVGCLAMGVRPVAIALVPAMVAALLFHTGAWGRRLRILAAPLVGGAFGVALLMFGRARLLRSADMTFVENSPTNRTAGLLDSVGFLPSLLPLTLVFAVAAAGMLILPVALAHLSRENIRKAAPITVLLIAVSGVLQGLGIGDWTPFTPCEIWSVTELGMAGCLTPSAVHPQFPPWLSTGLSLAAVTIGSVIVVVASEPVRRHPGGAFLAWVLLALLGISALVWLFHFDRYALPFAVVLTALAMATLSSVRTWPVVAGLVVYAAVSVAGTHDHLEYNRALWAAVDSLRSEGVPSGAIDAGYVVNGWLQYTYPQEAHRDADGAISIPMVNTAARLPYVVSHRVRPGTATLRTVPYSGWLYPDGVLYVLSDPSAAR